MIADKNNGAQSISIELDMLRAVIGHLVPERGDPHPFGCRSVRTQRIGDNALSNVVAVASRSLADWLTYDALALRVGDPYAELVERAGGAPGSLPRPLLGVPTIEVQVALRPRSELR